MERIKLLLYAILHSQLINKSAKDGNLWHLPQKASEDWTIDIVQLVAEKQEFRC